MALFKPSYFLKNLSQDTVTLRVMSSFELLWKLWCLSLFGLPKQNAISLGGLNNRASVSDHSGGWRSKIRVPDGQGRVDSWFRASLPFHMMRGVRGSLRSIL